MKNYKILKKAAVCMALCLTAANPYFALLAAGIRDLPKVSAASAALYDRLSGEFYYKKDADTRRPMASTTKIMTAVVALENSNADDEVTVSYNAAAVEGSRMYLREGEKISVKDLLYGLMLSSGNDAAIALAEHIGNGSSYEFVELMNKKAEQLGLKDTCFETPNGLDGDSHYTTAAELAIITDYALKNEQFCKIVSTRSYKTDTGNHYLTNHNKLLNMYEYSTGVKTGFTKKSGRCLVSSADKDGRQLIAVTLNAPDDWNDHINMLNYGFSQFTEKYELKSDEAVRQIPVIGNGKISVFAESDICINLTEREKRDIKAEIIGKKFVYPPVKKGDIYGKLVLTCRGTELLRVNLRYDKS